MSTRRRTAWVAEDALRRPVRYSVFVDEPAGTGWRFVEQGPRAATVDVCVEWALARADQVVVRMGEAFFHAGPRRDPGQEDVPAWPPTPEERERAERDVDELAARAAAMRAETDTHLPPKPPARADTAPSSSKATQVDGRGWTGYAPPSQPRP